MLFRRPDRSKGKNFIIGAALGTLAGGIAAFLFAPKAGKELRKDIGRTCKDCCCKTKDLANDVCEQCECLCNKAKDAARKFKNGK